MVYNLWRTGAAVAMVDDAEAAASWGRPIGPRTELEREKKTLLKAIKEAEFDHQMGKLSKADADHMMAVYRARAIELIKALEQTAGGSVREQIERELRARLEVDAKTLKKAEADAAVAEGKTKKKADASVKKKADAAAAKQQRNARSRPTRRPTRQRQRQPEAATATEAATAAAAAAAAAAATATEAATETATEAATATATATEAATATATATEARLPQSTGDRRQATGDRQLNGRSPQATRRQATGNRRPAIGIGNGGREPAARPHDAQHPESASESMPAKEATS